MRATARLPALLALLLAGCAPPSAPAPRVDLARVAAEVVATHAAQPSPAGALTAPLPTPTTGPPAPAEPVTPPSAAPTPSPAPTPPQAAPTPTNPPPPRPPPTPEPAAAAPPPSAAPAVAAPPAPAPLAGRLGPGGTFARFGFDYPGDRSVFTVNLHVEPDDPTLLANAGFVVYGPGGEEIVRGGAQPGLRPNVSADVIHTRRGPYLVQVHNYHPSRPISYRVELRAAPPPGH
jgi:hypothetical protein